MKEKMNFDDFDFSFLFSSHPQFSLSPLVFWQSVELRDLIAFLHLFDKILFIYCLFLPFRTVSFTDVLIYWQIPWIVSRTLFLSFLSLSVYAFGKQFAMSFFPHLLSLLIPGSCFSFDFQVVCLIISWHREGGSISWIVMCLLWFCFPLVQNPSFRVVC
jgi:hypothetical protein